MATKTGASTVGFDFRGGGDSTTMNYRFDGWNNAVISAPSVGAEWVKMSLSLNTSLNVYTNGVLVGTYNKNTLTHQYGFAIGNNAALNSWEFSGSIDEVRFAMFNESADWVKAEYDTEVSPTFLSNAGARSAIFGLMLIIK